MVKMKHGGNHIIFIALIMLLVQHEISPTFSETSRLPSNQSKQPEISLIKKKGIYYLQGSIYIRSPLLDVWEVITGYDTLETIVPYLEHSRRLGSDEKGGIMVEQQGYGQFLFFKKRVFSLLIIRETYLKKIQFYQLEGDFEVYEGHWDIEPQDKGFLLYISMRIKPGFWVPTFLFKSQFRRSTLKMLHAIAKEARERSSPGKINPQ